MKAGTALVDRIRVEDRFRRDLGDIGPLADSVASIGLLHPIVVTSDLRLIAGHRRLEAVRTLGWREVDVRIADDIDAAVELLAAERDENTCRLDMKPSELVALGRRLEELERPKARERMAQAGAAAAPGRPSETSARAREPFEETRNVVGKALGVHGATYQRMKYVADRAEDEATPEPVREVATQALAEMDAGTLGAETAQKRVRQAEIVNAPDLDDTPHPEPSGEKRDGRTKLPAAERAAQIRELAEAGHVSRQIAKRIGIGVHQVRNIARDHDITLPDAAIGKQRAVDSNRIVRETVVAAEGLTFGLDLIDYGDLSPDDIAGWVESLTSSLRELKRLHRHLKEIAR